MSNHHKRSPVERGARGLLWAERLFITAGTAALIWCAAIVADAALAQWIARQTLETAAFATRPVLAPAADEIVSVPLNDAAPLNVNTVQRGSPIAELSIPRVQLSAIVLHGSDARTLRRGPGHLENTALPGEPGNVVIAGHRDSFFWPLRNIRVGDDIALNTAAGQFRYRVTSLSVVDPHDVSVVAPTHEAALTLITCYPFWVLGHAPDRFVVRAAAIVDAPARQVIDTHATAQEPERVSVVSPPNAAEPVVRHGDEGFDDESLVRQTLDRYRQAYNAHVADSNGARGPLRFEACAVSVIDDRATATCTSAPDGFDPQIRIFTLERDPGRWTIKSIVVNEILTSSGG